MSLIAEDLIYWLAAIRLPSVTPKKFMHWLQSFNGIQNLFHANLQELYDAGLTQKEASLLKGCNWALLKQELQHCLSSNIFIITIRDESYPKLLREIVDAPLVLFVQGNVSLLHSLQIAMVGTRNPTPSGRDIATTLAKNFASNGLVVTSGLALGIDAASHKGALQSGQTIAVLGSGLSNLYPKSHRQLAADIIKQGALVSEFPPNTPPKAYHFPRRNRLISGLSVGVIVVEAAVRSGSLITARYALEQGREVFAVPGCIYNGQAHGCHRLIQQGAKLIETVQDVLEELVAPFLCLNPSNTDIGLSKNTSLNAKQLKLLEKIDYQATSLDIISLRSGLTVAQVSSMLLQLELSGYVSIVPGGYTRIG
jgi:DNA processing protein